MKDPFKMESKDVDSNCPFTNLSSGCTSSLVIPSDSDVRISHFVRPRIHNNIEGSRQHDTF